MNLNQNPTVDQLKVIVAACDDEETHHILWVDNTGEVRVTPLPDDITPSGFERKFPTTLLRFETYHQGNGYVGQEAADDEAHMNSVFNSLVREWATQNGRTITRYIG
ncbi:hypothetical protein [Massilia sp. CCM 8734]|uniref:hypothetical protein n=1 Tax=Massilia sp. CCM 8734 TaxID=2609283 RepID=UPI00142152C8|nr:hypothetical protein [Massilia sp. CCM 8734]NHZ94568.1 hypothetical protein [Massilia sp. CCM 8734]